MGQNKSPFAVVAKAPSMAVKYPVDATGSVCTTLGEERAQI